MAAKKSVSVRILDQPFSFTTDAQPERVKQIADSLNKNLQAAMSKLKSGSPYHAAVLVALNLTEKYLEATESREDLKSRVTAKSKKIMGLLKTAGVSSERDVSS